MTDKFDNAYKTIGEVAKILELKSKKKRSTFYAYYSILGNTV